MQTNLKTLSRQYANGMLSKQDYRQARSELIEKAQDSDCTEPQTTVPQEEENGKGDSSSAAEDNQRSAAQPAADNKSCKQKNQLLLGLVVLLTAAIGYLTWA